MSAKDEHNVSQITKSPVQMAFAILAGLIIFMFIPFTYESYIIHQEALKNLPEGYVFPQLSDLSITLYWTIGLTIVSEILKKIFYHLFLPYCKEQKNLQERDRRSKKAALNIYVIIYFSCMVKWGYSLLKDKYWFPVMLGGVGDHNRQYENYPYGDPDPKIGKYLLISQAYHLASCISHFMNPAGKDYFEMGLHHIATVFLYSFSYYHNIWEVAANIAFLHDIVDIWTGITKSLAESIFESATVIAFLSLQPVWFYTRLIVFPQIVYQEGQSAPERWADYHVSKYFLCFLLSCLVCLHAYWQYLFLCILHHYAIKGERNDMQEGEQSIMSENPEDKVTGDCGQKNHAKNE